MWCASGSISNGNRGKRKAFSVLTLRNRPPRCAGGRSRSGVNVFSSVAAKHAAFDPLVALPSLCCAGGRCPAAACRVLPSAFVAARSAVAARSGGQTSAPARTMLLAKWLRIRKPEPGKRLPQNRFGPVARPRQRPPSPVSAVPDMLSGCWAKVSEIGNRSATMAFDGASMESIALSPAECPAVVSRRKGFSWKGVVGSRFRKSK